MKEDRLKKITALLGAISVFAVLVALPPTVWAQDTPKKPEVPSAVEKPKEAEVPKKSPYADADLSVKIIPSANNTFGYDILIYGRPLVHQPSIPGLPGNEGFTTKERAQKVADLVMKKIKNNEMPPTVTIEELSNLGALK
jgi:hypothetical protein